MKIAITGASGFVASLLIPRLRARGAELLLVTRDPAALAGRYPGAATCTVDQLASRGAGCDLLLDLAARNNDQGGDLAAFRADNVDAMVARYHAAREAGIASFVNVSSIHALDPRNEHPYARSKREGTAALQALDGPTVGTLYLATVYGERWSGKLALLNGVPRGLAVRLFTLLAACKPTVHIDRIVDRLLGGDLAGDAVLTDGQETNRVYQVATRAISLVAGMVVLVALSWLLLGLWVAIRLTSAGPAVFAQRRLGQGGRPFTCYKFRTMRVGTGHVGTHEVAASAITPLGRFLRSTKLDELPQAVNLIRNQMHLIGPRPGLPVQSELAAARAARGVDRLKPGISGLSQVHGLDMSAPTRLAQSDERYLQLQSLVLDLKLMVATVAGGGRGDPAQRSLKPAS